MPRIRFGLAPQGLHLNNDETLQPEGTLRIARNVANLSGQGFVRSAPPYQGLGSVAIGRAMTLFNNRFILRGESGSPVTQMIGRATTQGGLTLVSLSLPTTPAVNLRSTDQPTLFTTASPIPGKDEYLFILEPANQPGDNALLKLSDAGTLSHWGILPPKQTDVTTIQLTKGTQQKKYINTVASDPMDDSGAPGGNTVDWVLSAGDEDGLSPDSFSHVETGTTAPGSSRCVKFRAGANDVAQITRTFATPVNLTTFGTTASGDGDFIQFWVKVRRPATVKALEIQFDTNDGTFTSMFHREVQFVLVKPRQRRKLIGHGDLVPEHHQAAYLRKHASKTLDLSLAEEQGKPRIPVGRNAWERVTLPKSTFDGEGNWATVKAVRFVLHATQAGKAAIYLDELAIVGGAGLHGDYEYTITYTSEDGTPRSSGARSNPPLDDGKGTYTGIPNALVTARISGIERQAVTLTFPNGLTFDPQVNRIEIWRTVGNGKAFFRAGYITVSGGTLSAGYQFVDSAADYYGMSDTAANVTSGNNVSFAVLDPAEELPLDNTSPNDPSFAFQDMVDRPHMGRMWWARNVAAIREDDTTDTSAQGGRGLVYYSPPGRLEAVEAFVPVTSGISDPVQKIVVWSERLFAFTTSSLYEIVGSDEPFVAQKIEGAPGTIYPFTVVPTTVGIIYLSQDGVYLFNGQQSTNITDPVLMPIFRFLASTEELVVQTPPTSIRAVAGRNAYYLGLGLVTGFVMVFDLENGSWRYLEGGANGWAASGTNRGMSFYDAFNNRVLVDFGSGINVGIMDPSVYPTTGVTNTFNLKYGSYRTGPGRKGILRKVFADITVGPSGTLSSANVVAVVDGAENTFTFPNGTAGQRIVQEYNLNLPGERFGVRFLGNAARDVRINAMEMDIYEPGELDPS
jgi:hypothetical protein